MFLIKPKYLEVSNDYIYIQEKVDNFEIVTKNACAVKSIMCIAWNWNGTICGSVVNHCTNFGKIDSIVWEMRAAKKTDRLITPTDRETNLFPTVENVWNNKKYWNLRNFFFQVPKLNTILLLLYDRVGSSMYWNYIFDTSKILLLVYCFFNKK